MLHVGLGLIRPIVIDRTRCNPFGIKKLNDKFFNIFSLHQLSNDSYQIILDDGFDENW